MLIRKLEGFQPLSKEDRALIEKHVRPMREVRAKRDLISEGDNPTSVFLIVGGLACRYKLTEDGKRQIMAYFVPGDFCDFQVFILDQMDHGIAALSNTQVIEFQRETILELTERPAIARAFWWASLVDLATLREWLVNIGQRPADERVAHLLCELLVRLSAVGLVRDGSYALPITQADLGDTMGITVVHANRTLAKLREAGLIDFDHGRVFVKDVPALIRFSGFDPKYLHLRSADQHLQMPI